MSELDHQSGTQSLEHVLDSLNSILEHKQLGSTHVVDETAPPLNTVTMRHPHHAQPEPINEAVMSTDIDDADIPILNDIISLGETLKPETDSPEIQAILSALHQELNGIVDDILIDARTYLLRASSSNQDVCLEEGMKRFLHELIKRLPQ